MRTPESVAEHIRNILDSMEAGGPIPPGVELLLDLLAGLERDGRKAAPCLFDSTKMGRPKIRPVEHVRRRFVAQRALAEAKAEMGEGRPMFDYEVFVQDEYGIAPSTLRDWLTKK